MNEGREAIRSSVRLLIVLDLPQQTTTKKKQCEDVSKLPSSEDACAFAKLHCDTGSLIPYPELYYCLAQPAGPLAAALAALLAAAALVALFRALSATAGDYFTPALTRAAAAARMPPRLAGAMENTPAARFDIAPMTFIYSVAGVPVEGKHFKEVRARD